MAILLFVVEVGVGIRVGIGIGIRVSARFEKLEKWPFFLT